MEDMEALFEKTRHRVTVLENQNQDLQVNVEEKEVKVVRSTEELDNLRAEKLKLEEEVRSLRDTVSTKDRQLEDLKFANSSAERKLRSLEDELVSKQTEVAGLKVSVAELTSASAGVEAKLKVTASDLEAALGRVAELEALAARQAQEVAAYQEKQRCNETERRKLHNTIQELKGNIRVFCRIRPLLRSEDFAGNRIRHISVTGDKSLEISKAASGKALVGPLQMQPPVFKSEFFPLNRRPDELQGVA